MSAWAAPVQSINRRKTADQRTSWLISMIGISTASTMSEHHRAHRQDEQRLEQRAEGERAALGLAREVGRGALEHRGRELAGGFAARGEVHQHRREHLGAAERPATAYCLRARCSMICAHGRARAPSCAQRRAAASSARRSGTPAPARMASVQAKRAVSMPRRIRPKSGRRSSMPCQREPARGQAQPRAQAEDPGDGGERDPDAGDPHERRSRRGAGASASGSAWRLWRNTSTTCGTT